MVIYNALNKAIRQREKELRDEHGGRELLRGMPETWELKCG